MPNYQILFSGAVHDNFDKNAVAVALTRELNIDAGKAKHLFSGRTVVLKSQLSEGDAQALQERYTALGAVVRTKNLEPKSTLPMDYEPDRASDSTLRDLTAAHVECPRCGHMQLESSHCARCGVDMEALFKQRRKEDRMIEKKLADLRRARTATVATQAAVDAEIALDDSDATTQNAGKLGKIKRWFSRSR